MESQLFFPYVDHFSFICTEFYLHFHYSVTQPCQSLLQFFMVHFNLTPMSKLLLSAHFLTSSTSSFPGYNLWVECINQSNYSGHWEPLTPTLFLPSSTHILVHDMTLLYALLLASVWHRTLSNISECHPDLSYSCTYSPSQRASVTLKGGISLHKRKVDSSHRACIHLGNTFVNTALWSR